MVVIIDLQPMGKNFSVCDCSPESFRLETGDLIYNKIKLSADYLD
jgi:hypothetical protein